MTQQLEAMKLAYDDTWNAGSEYPIPSFDDVVSFAKKLQAIEQAQKQEPVADTHDFIAKTNREYADWCATYYQPESLDERGFMSLHGLWAWQEQERRKTSPPQRQPLTDEEIWKNDAIMSANSAYGAAFDTLRDVVRASEAAHGIRKG